MNLSQLPTPLKQAIKFFSVGMLNTVIDIFLYFVLTRSFNFFANLKTIAKAISYGVGVLNSFYWNRRWTFRSQVSFLILVPYVLVNLSGLLLNAGVLYISLNRVPYPESLLLSLATPITLISNYTPTAHQLIEIISLALATGVTFIWNFIVNKFVIFRQ